MELYSLLGMMSQGHKVRTKQSEHRKTLWHEIHCPWFKNNVWQRPKEKTEIFSETRSITETVILSLVVRNPMITLFGKSMLSWTKESSVKQEI